MAATKSPRSASAIRFFCTEGRVRSYCSPCNSSHSRDVNPCALIALARFPEPANRSATYRPFNFKGRAALPAPLRGQGQHPRAVLRNFENELASRR